MRILISIFLLISFSFAHKLNLFLIQEGDEVYASAYFASGSFCKNCELTVKNANGEVIQEGKTDKKGEFIITKLASKIIVDVKTAEGHAAKYTLNIKEITGKKEESKEINELKQEIAKLKSENKLLKEKLEQNELLKMLFALIVIAGIFLLLKRIKK